jgi:hypothetical protein
MARAFCSGQNNQGDRDLKLSRNTVRKVLRSAETAFSYAFVFLAWVQSDLTRDLTIRPHDFGLVINLLVDQFPRVCVESCLNPFASFADQRRFALEDFKQTRRLPRVAGELQLRPAGSDREKIDEGRVHPAEFGVAVRANPVGLKSAADRQREDLLLAARPLSEAKDADHEFDAPELRGVTTPCL